MHDTIIIPRDLNNSLNIVFKLLQLQYADARAHHPDKVQKRIIFLDTIKEDLLKLILSEQENEK